MYHALQLLPRKGIDADACRLADTNPADLGFLEVGHYPHVFCTDQAQEFLTGHHELPGLHILVHDHPTLRGCLPGVLQFDAGQCQGRLSGLDPVLFNFQRGLVGQGTFAGCGGVVAGRLQLVAQGAEACAGGFQVLGTYNALVGQAPGALIVAAGLFDIGRQLTDGGLCCLTARSCTADLAVHQAGHAALPGGHQRAQVIGPRLFNPLLIFVIAHLEQQVPFVHARVFVHRHVHHHAAQPRPDRDDHAFHFGIVGADVLPCVLPALQPECCQACDDQHRYCQLGVLAFHHVTRSRPCRWGPEPLACVGRRQGMMLSWLLARTWPVLPRADAVAPARHPTARCGLPARRRRFSPGSAVAPVR